MIAHRAVAVQIEWLAFFQIGDGVEKSDVIAFVAKDRLPVIATIDYVVHKPVVDRSQGSRYGNRLARTIAFRGGK